MKKVLLIVLSVFVVLVLGIGLLKDHLAKFAVVAAAKSVAGLKVEMEKFHIGILSSKLDIKGLKVYNSEDFGEDLMLDIPELYVDYYLFKLLSKNIHLSDLRVHLKQCTLVTNDKGVLNFTALAQGEGEEKEAKEEQKEKTTTEKKEDIKLQIDNFSLVAEKLVHKDYSKSEKAKVKEFELKINEKRTNVTDIKLFATSLATTILAKTTLGNIDDLTGGLLGDAAGLTGDAAKGAINLTGDAAKGVLNVGGDTLDVAGKAIDAINIFKKKD